jgi:hypothetical protein
MRLFASCLDRTHLKYALGRTRPPFPTLPKAQVDRAFSASSRELCPATANLPVKFDGGRGTRSRWQDRFRVISRQPHRQVTKRWNGISLPDGLVSDRAAFCGLTRATSELRHEIWDLTRLVRALRSRQRTESITINFEERFGQTLAVPRHPRPDQEGVQVLLTTAGTTGTDAGGNSTNDYRSALLARKWCARSSPVKTA